MKYELRTKKWFLHKDGKIVQGLITKRELLEIDDHDDGQKSIRRYWLRTSWKGNDWVEEELLFDSVEKLVASNTISYID